MYKRATAKAVSCLALAGCLLTVTFIADQPAQAAQITSAWRPTTIGGVKLPRATKMFVRFDGNGRVTGHAGCNRFFGTYKLTGNRITIGPLAATRMACKRSIMRRESLFLRALGYARHVVRKPTRLSLIDRAGKSVARFVRK